MAGSTQSLPSRLERLVRDWLSQALLPFVLIGLLQAIGGRLAVAEPPEVTTIINKMKDSIEPARPSRSRMVITVHSEGETVEWTGHQARKQLADGKHILTVILEPESVRGVALLVWEPKDQPEVQWIYLPAVRRVRKLIPVSAFESFFNTDFTFYDLGFIALNDRGFALLGEDTEGSRRVYKVQEVPRNPYYYSRVVTWVAEDSFLPLHRDYYDGAGALWKIERFENVTTIDGVPTPLRIVMEDKQAGTSSELRFSSVRYDVAVPDELFDPKNLPKAAAHPSWRAGG